MYHITERRLPLLQHMKLALPSPAVTSRPHDSKQQLGRALVAAKQATLAGRLAGRRGVADALVCVTVLNSASGIMLSERYFAAHTRCLYDEHPVGQRG